MILILPVAIYASGKIESKLADEIVNFTLFNYDNLIADHYESQQEYIQQLAFLLHKGTLYPINDFMNILNSEELTNESNPVRYMKLLNQKTESFSGYNFVEY